MSKFLITYFRDFTGAGLPPRSCFCFKDGSILCCCIRERRLANNGKTCWSLPDNVSTFICNWSLKFCALVGALRPTSHWIRCYSVRNSRRDSVTRHDNYLFVPDQSKLAIIHETCVSGKETGITRIKNQRLLHCQIMKTGSRICCIINDNDDNKNIYQGAYCEKQGLTLIINLANSF